MYVITKSHINHQDQAPQKHPRDAAAWLVFVLTENMYSWGTPLKNSVYTKLISAFNCI